ncbi:recombinase family protein [Rhodococcus rhodochrous]|uniref:recombinase family protein n=1 Tax=Rhodococcus rhodochrous TaxID=1829 RepID=UPI0002E5C3C1|nr:recombinase family protein [Rhodococcus rhodochrous]
MTETSTPTGRTFGYARVSTTRQNLDRQLDAIAGVGVDPDRIYVDKVTGRTMDRPEWRRLDAHLKEGDRLVVDNLDRLGRSALEVINTVNHLTKDRRVVVQSIAQGILDPSTSNGALMLGMFALLAQFEVDLKAERAAAAREAAKARGKHTGRPKKLDRDDVSLARDYRKQGLTAAEIGKKLNVSRATVYRYLSDEVRG